MLTLEQLQERIILKYDPDELVDLLSISSEELLEHFSHRILLYRDRFISEEYFEDEYEYEQER